MPEIATRLPRARTQTSPEWAQVLRTFYAKSFDTGSEESFVESVEAFCALSPDEQAFHQAHLAYRQVQALDDIYGCLRRLEAGLDPKALGALRHLPGIRKALVVIARGQEEMLDLLESGAGGDKEESELAEAMEDEEIEEEDHGDGSVEVLTVDEPAPVELP